MVIKNKNLTKAKKEKNDEFYTQYKDIEKEVSHYKSQLKDKIIFCNCDNPERSNFSKYFSDNFELLGLKKLLSYGGDFRSKESIEMLKECDIVVTNPPFSLFREYVAQLMEYGKKFLILGNNNAITYKEIFPYIRDNKLRLGYSSNKTMEFQLGDEYDKWNYIKDDKKYGHVPAISWFTNLNKDAIGEIILTKEYTPDYYPKYDNYDAINVDKVKDIPKDYFGLMGVPITYISVHNPYQFEILGIDKDLVKELTGKVSRFILNSNMLYARIVIKRKQQL